jgi:hypothetical protein
MQRLKADPRFIDGVLSDGSARGRALAAKTQDHDLRKSFGPRAVSIFRLCGHRLQAVKN